MPRTNVINQDVSHQKLLRDSLSASIQNAAGPIGLALQHVVLGKRSSVILAAFGVCVNVSNLGTSVFQFLVDGSISKVGGQVAKGDDGELKRHVQRSFFVSILSGAMAGVVLMLSGDGLFSALGETEKLSVGKGYYYWRCAAMPFKTSSNASVGVLGGFGHVHVVSLMNSAVAILQVAMVCVVLRMCSAKGERGVLDALGLAYFVVVMFHSILGWTIVYFSPPKRIGLERKAVKRRRETARENAEGEREEEEEESKKYFVDALNMFGRSILLQLSFFIAVLVASRKLSVEGLAAHHLTAQLWLVCSYIVDGFATIATIYGSRLYSIRLIKKLRVLTVRLLSYGVSLGFFFCIVFLGFGNAARKLFVGTDKETNYYLSKTWRIVSLAQPVNAMVFVLDGLMYATKSYAYAREIMVAGVGVVFLPTILSATLIKDGNLNSGAKVIARIWTAKLALNVWRMLFLLGRVFLWILKEEDRSEEGEEDDEEENERDTGSEGSDDDDIEESLIESDIDDDAPLLTL